MAPTVINCESISVRACESVVKGVGGVTRHVLGPVEIGVEG